MIKSYTKKLLSILWQKLLAFSFGVSLISGGSTLTGRRVHIFGSGPSAKFTRDFVHKMDCFYACNHAVKWMSYWDVVFVESVDSSSFGKDQIRLLKEASYGLLVCKNNYPNHPFRCFFKMLRLRKFERLMILPEYQATPDEVISDLNHISDHGRFVFPQYASSILTMILFAVRSGAQDIWLHGVDSLSHRRFVLDNSKPHATECLPIPFSVVLNRVQPILQEYGVTIKIAEVVN